MKTRILFKKYGGVGGLVHSDDGLRLPQDQAVPIRPPQGRASASPQVANRREAPLTERSETNRRGARLTSEARLNRRGARLTSEARLPARSAANRAKRDYRRERR